MNEMKTVSLSSIIADYRREKLAEELATDWGSLVFYRGPAFLLVWAVVPLGVTPSQLTVLGVLLTPVMAASAWLLAPTLAVPVITLLALAFNVLDCADGSLARATGRSSLAGRYLDFAADIFYRSVAYACYGFVADRLWPGATFPWLAVGLCCGLLATYTRVNRIYAQKLFPAGPGGSGRRPSSGELAFAMLSGIDTLLPLIAFAAWWAGALWLALAWFLIYTSADAALEIVGNYARARRIDAEAGPKFEGAPPKGGLPHRGLDRAAGVEPE